MSFLPHGQPKAALSATALARCDACYILAVPHPELLARVRALLDVGRNDEALSLLMPASTNSSSAQLHSLIIVTLSRLGRAAEAAQAAEHGLALVGLEPSLTCTASYAFLGIKQHKKAVAAAQAAVDAAPEWVPALLALATMQSAAGKRKAAQTTMETALELSSDDASTHIMAGAVTTDAQRYKAAKSHYKDALRIEPENIDALSGLGLIEEKRGRLGKAASWYTAVLSIRPGDARLGAQLHGLLGQILGYIAAAALMLHFALLIAFMMQANPAPKQAPPSVIVSMAIAAGMGAILGLLLWGGLRAFPPEAREALRSDMRLYSSARRCFRRTLAQLVLLGIAIVIAANPIGTPHDHLPLFFMTWLLGMLVAIVNLIGLRRTFGYGLVRRARSS